MRYNCIVIILLALLTGCGKRPDAATVPCRIIRFDRILFSLDHARPDLSGIHPEDFRYFSVYAEEVLQLGRVADPEFTGYLSSFLSDTVMQAIYDTVGMTYPEMASQESELAQAFGYCKHYFPQMEIPRIYAHISGFNQSIIVDSAVVGIGLENYLGADARFYDLLMTPIPLYIRKKMTPDHMVRDVVYAWLSSEFPYEPQKHDLLSGLIYQGKMVYLMEKILPDYAQERLFNYEKEQLQWCRNNESGIWAFLIDREYLYTTTQLTLTKYLNDAPFSSGMPTESPGRAAVWNGYRIVGQYAENTNVSLEALMSEQDYHKMLRLSRYRP